MGIRNSKWLACDWVVCSQVFQKVTQKLNNMEDLERHMIS